MRFVDLMLAFPAIFLLLILFAMYGSSVLSVVLFLGALLLDVVGACHPGRVHVAQGARLRRGGAIHRRPERPIIIVAICCRM